MRMRTCLAIMIVCCAASAARADVTAMMGSNTQPAQPKDEPKVVQMTVAALAEAEPALKHHLLPTLTEQKPGNSILMYYLAQQLIPDIGDAAEIDKRKKQIAKYLDMPLEELPVEKVREFLEYYYRIVLKQVEIGAMREDADWGLPFEEGMAMIIPTMSDFRDMARLLALRARVEIAQGRFDQAIHTIKVGMAMGRHVAEDPILITAMVGIAMENLMLDRVQELIGHGGPNMYWALAELPEPLVDVRRGFDYERQWLMREPELRKALAGPMTPAEGTALLRWMVELYSLAMSTGEEPPGRRGIVQAALAVRFYGIGKRMLIEDGRSRQEVEAMPVGQVAVLYLLNDYLHWRDELFKWFSMPYWQARPGLQRSEKAFQEWQGIGGMFNPLTALLPSFGRAYLMQAKLDRARAALQTIESIRSHAARHGQVPKTLDDLELPVPIDPVVGKQFQYEPGDQSFTLIGPASEGEQAKEGVRYEVHLTPAKKAPTATTAPAGATPAALPAKGAWQGIDSFIQDGTIAVIQIDLAALTSDAAWQQISTVVQELKLGDEVLPMLTQVRGMGGQYVKVGLTEAFVVVNITDLPDTPMIVVPLTKGADVEKLSAMLPKPGDRAVVRQVDGTLVVATEGQFRLLAETGAAKRPRLMKALTSTKGAVRVAFAFSDDVRRALEETIGTLPPELGNLPGTTLTRGLQWACVDVAVLPEITLRLTIQSADADSAQSMSRLIDLLAMKATADRIKGHYIAPKVFEILESFIKTLRPSVSGDQLVLTLNQVSLLRDCVGPAMQKFRTMARRETSDSVIRQLLAALYLWAAANQGVFPPDLQTLVKTGVTGPQNLINPSRPELGQAGYVYLRPNVPLSKLEDPGGQVVLYEAHERFGEGVNVGFADGHVGWIADQARFQALLSASKSNEATSQPTTAPSQPD